MILLFSRPLYLFDLTHFRKRKIAQENDGPEPKKARQTEEEKSNLMKEKEEMKKQNKKMFYYRDQLERQLKKNELQELLESNGQEICPGVDSVCILP